MTMSDRTRSTRIQILAAAIILISLRTGKIWRSVLSVLALLVTKRGPETCPN